MTESIGAVRIDIIGNAEDLKVEVERAKTLVASMGPEFEKSFQKMTASQKTATVAALKFEQQIGKTSDEIKLLALGARGAAPEALERLRLKLLETRGAAQATGSAIAGQTKAFSGSSKTARELQFAMRGLPAQITDIGVSLASGQRPLMVLLQQGGQLKDMFGGIAPAARALGVAVRGLINPLTLGAGAIGLLALSWRNAANEADAFNKAIILSGNYAGTSRDELEAMAERIAAVSSASKGAASDVVAQVAATGRFTAEQIELVSRAALEMKDAAGTSVDETIQQFVRLADDPVSAIDALNKSQHLLDKATRDQIASLKDQGKEADAAALLIKSVADAYLDRADDVERHLSLWGTGWHDVATGAKSAFDALVRGITDADTAAAQASSLVQMLTTVSPTLGAAVGGWAATVKARAGSGVFANVRGNVSTVAADPTDQLAADWQALQDAVYGPAAIEAQNRAAEAWAKAGDKAVKALRPVADAAKAAARAMEALNREEARLEAASFAKIDAQTQAMVKFAEMKARAMGPDALARFQYEQQLQDVEDTGHAAGKSDAEIERLKALILSPDQQAALDRQKDILAEQARIMSGVQFAAEDMFASFLDGSKSASDAFEDFANNLRRIAARILAEKAIQYVLGLFGGYNPSNYSDSTGLAGMGDTSLPVPNAKGGAYNSPSLSAYSGGIYNTPHLFKFAKGAGIFGEAGPEAIMPLKRGSDGKLGVQASGAAGPQEINIRIVGAPSQPDARAVPNGSGGFDLELVFKQLEGRMASSTMRRGSPMNQAVQTVQRASRGVPVSS